MSSPKKEELPKLANPLAKELTKEHVLSHVETEEKIVLPTKEQLESERKEKSLLSEIESFSPAGLQHADTLEKNPLPTKEELLAEKQNSA